MKAKSVASGAIEMGKRIRVLADETRPYLQGARLTAWELHKDGIPVEVIADNMAGWFMKRGEIAAVVVGADRIANAVAAHHPGDAGRHAAGIERAQNGGLSADSKVAEERVRLLPVRVHARPVVMARVIEVGQRRQHLRSTSPTLRHIRRDSSVRHRAAPLRLGPVIGASHGRADHAEPRRQGAEAEPALHQTIGQRAAGEEALRRVQRLGEMEAAGARQRSASSAAGNSPPNSIASRLMRPAINSLRVRAFGAKRAAGLPLPLREIGQDSEQFRISSAVDAGHGLPLLRSR